MIGTVFEGFGDTFKTIMKLVVFIAFLAGMYSLIDEQYALYMRSQYNNWMHENSTWVWGQIWNFVTYPYVLVGLCALGLVWGLKGFLSIARALALFYLGYFTFGLIYALIENTSLPSLTSLSQAVFAIGVIFVADSILRYLKDRKQFKPLSQA
jgi:hypothetical protein